MLSKSRRALNRNSKSTKLYKIKRWKVTVIMRSRLRRKITTMGEGIWKEKILSISMKRKILKMMTMTRAIYRIQKVKGHELEGRI